VPKVSKNAFNLHFSSFTVILGYPAVRRYTAIRDALHLWPRPGLSAIRMLLPGGSSRYPRNDLVVDGSLVLG